MSGSEVLVNADTGEKIADCTPDEARELTDKIGTGIGVVWELIVRAYKSRAWAALGYPTWDAYTVAEFGRYRLRLPSEERAETVASLREAGLSPNAIAAAVGVGEGTVRRHLDCSGAPNGAPEQDRQPVEPAPSSAEAPGGEPETGSEAPAPASDPAPPTTGIDGKEYPTAAVAAAARRRATEAYAADPTLTVRALAKLAGCSVGTAQSIINPTESKAAPKPPRPALGGTAEKAGWEFRKAVERLERIAADDRFPANREQVAAVLRGHLTYAVEVCQDLLDGFDTEPQEAP